MSLIIYPWILWTKNCSPLIYPRSWERVWLWKQMHLQCISHLVHRAKSRRRTSCQDTMITHWKTHVQEECSLRCQKQKWSKRVVLVCCLRIRKDALRQCTRRAHKEKAYSHQLAPRPSPAAAKRSDDTRRRKSISRCLVQWHLDTPSGPKLGCLLARMSLLESSLSILWDNSITTSQPRQREKQPLAAEQGEAATSH